MRKAIARLWQRNRLLLIGFAVACLLTLVFGMRAFMLAVYWNDPDHRDQAVAAWMTPHYVAHSWHVPPRVVRDALGLTERPADGMPTIGRLAEERGMPEQELALQIETAITEWRQDNR